MFANRPSWLFILHHKGKEWDKDQKMERQIYSRDRSPAAMSWPLAQLAYFGCCVRCFPWAKSQKHKKPSENTSRQRPWRSSRPEVSMGLLVKSSSCTGGGGRSIDYSWSTLLQQVPWPNYQYNGANSRSPDTSKLYPERNEATE